MKSHWVKYALTGALITLLAACSSKPTDRGQQYKDGKLEQPLALVNQPMPKAHRLMAETLASRFVRFSPPHPPCIVVRTAPIARLRAG